ncbi:hypothetical protein [Thiomonas sp.]|uniref:hypothetical protein n=1 Tax=Thiomonas sp. TaxID=2047785 RepID=UPI0025875436|nr:hypothetical protein [Thiomonas sp.]
MSACFAHLAAAQSVKEAVTFSAQWQVHLQQDGKGSDSRGAQWLVLLGGLGGQEGVATAQDQVSWPAQGNGAYRIDSTLTPRGALAVLLRRLHWVRGASGEVRDGKPELLSASNQRGDSPATLMQIEHGRMQVTTAGQAASAPAESTTPTQPAPPGLTDPLTLSWGYLQRPPPTRTFTVPLLINDKVQTAHITPQRTTLKWQGQEVACTLLDAHSAQSSATLRIWLRQSDGLPLQVELGMGDRYGLDVVQTLAAVPDGLPAAHVQH